MSIRRRRSGPGPARGRARGGLRGDAAGDRRRALAADPADLHRYFSIPADTLAAKIAGLGEGLYIIGLANHIGFVVVDGGDVRLVHASYTDGQVVIDEPLVSARAIADSRPKGYFVTPVMHDDRLADLWLRGAPVPLQPK